MKERKFNLDLLRVVLSLCVITAHSFHYFGLENDFIYTLFMIPLMSCDGLFYMISGYFNLEKNFENSTDIKKYYKSRFINVLFPFLAFVFVWTIWDFFHEFHEIHVGNILLTYYETVVDKGTVGHMWFMYPLFGLLLSAPFFSKMLHNMDEKELKMLWYIALGYNFLCYYLCWDLGIGFSILGWILDGWAIYFFVGYYYRHVIVNESGIKWAILAFIGFVVTLLGINGFIPFFEAFEGGTNIQPLFTLFCVGIFMFWDKVVKINNNVLKKVISFLSENTFMIYLFHTRGIEYVVRKLSITEESFVSGLLVVFGAYLISLLLAFIANLLLKPIQKLLNKIIVVK